MCKYKVILGILLTATIALAIVPVSMRMRGLGPDLVGIVDDEYSDLFFNPAYINRIDGTNIYTNLSGLNSEPAYIFDPTYTPSMYYNLIGGIATIRNIKCGALLETGGWNLKSTNELDSIEKVGVVKIIDSTKTEVVDNYINNTLNLIFGKKICNYDLGLMIAPQKINDEFINRTTTIHYQFSHDTMLSYNYNKNETKSKANVFALPLLAGVVMGEPENEMAFCFSFGYDKTKGVVPNNFMNASLHSLVSQSLTSLLKNFHEVIEKQESSGVFLALNGRNKRRSDEHSVSFLGEISYSHQPVKGTMTDTTYTLNTQTSGQKIESSELATQKFDGALNYFKIALGIGGEKKFEAFDRQNIFAIGLLPSYFTSNLKIKLEPEFKAKHYYQNVPDTTEYIEKRNNGEYYDIKNCTGGLSLKIPAGLETFLTNRLVLRLGVTQEITLTLKDCSEMVLADSGETYERDVLHCQNPSFRDTIITEPQDELDSKRSKAETKISMSNATTYHYGLGFKINDNIELNFLNFAQLTDLRRWQLGVNIKF
ncbi:MAG: hypothetical protein N2201_02595 [candidate division WOR-3 bacterium]|nr:hypothetical protein [candidate division WOR-3 bacterium]